MINVEIHSFFFLSVQFVPLIVEFRVQTEKILAMLGSRKRNSYVVPVWPGKTVLEMLFVGKYFVDTANLLGTAVATFNWAGPQSSTFQKCIQLQHLSAANLLFSHSSDVYKSFKTLFVCFDGLSVK